MKSFPLPIKLEDFMPSLVKHFNSCSIIIQMELYEPEAVFVMDDGYITDQAALTGRLETDLKPGIPLMANVRHIFIAEDIAQIAVD